MKVCTSLLLACVFSVAGYAADNSDAQNIAGQIMVNGHSMQYLQELTDRFGGRLTGSPAYNAAAQWAAEQFRAMGIKNVRLEPFTIPHNWQRGTSHGRITAPYERALHIEPLGWSVATPQGGIRANVTVVDDVHADALQKRASEIRDHVVLIDTTKLFDSEDKSYNNSLLFQYAPAVLQKIGAKGVLFGGSRPEQVLSTTAL